MSEATTQTWTRAEIYNALRGLLECETCEEFTAAQQEHIEHLLRLFEPAPLDPEPPKP